MKHGESRGYKPFTHLLYVYQPKREHSCQGELPSPSPDSYLVPMPCYMTASDSGDMLLSPAFPPDCNSVPKAHAQTLPQEECSQGLSKGRFPLVFVRRISIPKCTVSTGLEAIPITQVFLSHSSVVMEDGSAAAQSVVSEDGEKSI